MVGQRRQVGESLEPEFLQEQVSRPVDGRVPRNTEALLLLDEAETLERSDGRILVHSPDLRDLTSCDRLAICDNCQCLQGCR